MIYPEQLLVSTAISELTTIGVMIVVIIAGMVARQLFDRD